MLKVPYGQQTITQEDIQAVTEVLTSDFLTRGPAVDAFELEMGKYLNAPYAVAVSNGTAALHLAALALGITSGDKVLVTTNSFVASANAIRYCGAEVEFVDIEKETFCISIESLKQKLSNSPQGTYKAIVAVDFAGHPANWYELHLLATEHKLFLIEDACHALGASFNDFEGNKVICGDGKLSDLTVFSFHPVKHLTTGEGGLITTRSSDLDKKLRMLRTHGITAETSEFQNSAHGLWYYEMQNLGYNYRITDIQCALGLSQLKRMPANILRRREIAEIYRNELNFGQIQLPVELNNYSHAYHLFVIQIEKRKELYNYLRTQGIFAQVHYIPIHEHPYYVNLYGQQTLKNAEKYYSMALSLPMYHGLDDAKLEYVISKIKAFYCAF